jgi:hypothetical protein
MVGVHKGPEASAREDPTACGRLLVLRSTIADCSGPIAGSSQAALGVVHPWVRVGRRVVDPDRSVAVVDSLGPGVDSHGFVEGSLDPEEGTAVAGEDNLLQKADLGRRTNLKRLDLREQHLRVRREMNLCLASIKRPTCCVTIFTVSLLLWLLVVVIEQLLHLLLEEIHGYGLLPEQATQTQVLVVETGG